MRFETVKGFLFNDHINVNDKILWLTKDSKCSCNGYFLLKWLGVEYELLKVFEIKDTCNK